VNDILTNTTPLSPLTAVLPSPVMGAWPILSSLTGFKRAKRAFDKVGDLIEPYIEKHRVKTSSYIFFNLLKCAL